MYMSQHEREYLKQMIEEETAPLRERIEKLEAEREQKPAPQVTRPTREAPGSELPSQERSTP